MRALIAARLSRKQANGDEGIGLDTQDLRSREFVDRMGWVLAGVARDTITGTRAPVDRRQLGAWLSDPALLASFDCVVAYKTDRLSRGTQEDWSRIETWASDHGKVLVMVDASSGIRYPARDDSDYWQWTAAKRQARKEWEDIRERIGRAHDAIKVNSGLIGSPSYGYVITGQRYAKQLVPDPAEAALVQEAAAGYLNGSTLQKLCDGFNAEGRLGRNGALWSPKTLGQVLRNPAMSGRRMWAGYVLRVPPILDPDTQRKVIARMDARATRKGISQAAMPALLTSVIICPKCQRNMYRIMAGHGQSAAPYYYCRHGCKVMVPLPEADAWVDEELSAHPGFVVETAIVAGSGHAEEIKALEQDIRNLDLDDPSYDAQLARLRAERAALKAAPQTPARVDELVQPFTVGDHWRELDTAGRRDFLLQSGVKVIGERGAYRIEGDPGLIAANGRLTLPAA